MKYCYKILFMRKIMVFLQKSRKIYSTLKLSAILLYSLYYVSEVKNKCLAYFTFAI